MLLPILEEYFTEKWNSSFTHTHCFWKPRNVSFFQEKNIWSYLAECPSCFVPYNNSILYFNISASQCGMETSPVRTAKLCRVVRLAERISGSALPSLQDIYPKRCISRAAKIIKDSSYPGNLLFFLLPSGKRFRNMMAKTERLRRSFFPQAIRLLNSNL